MRTEYVCLEDQGWLWTGGGWINSDGREMGTGDATEMVEDLFPWACVVRQVEGGYRAWESMADVDTWENQR